MIIFPATPLRIFTARFSLYLYLPLGFSRWCLSNGQAGAPASAGLSVAELVNGLKPPVKSG